jgi:BirA family biotin operon repressor/biotin-[acetyl-CoA-carboxylase] ligase
MSASDNLSTCLSQFNHKHVTSSASTNSELIDAIKEGSLSADTAHLLTAETQTAGRGQRGRSWQSPRGNVYLSLYHPISVPVSGLLSLVIGLELATMPVIQILNEQLLAQGLTPIGVKWANDLGFYKRKQSSTEPVSENFKDSQEVNENIMYFSKLAGILIEPVWRLGKLVGVVMGVGLNVQATPKLTSATLEGMSYQALSLQDISRLLEPQTSRAFMTQLPSLSTIYQQISHALVAAISSFEHMSAEKISQLAINPQALGSQAHVTNNFIRQFDAMDALAGLRLQVTQTHNSEPFIINGHACGINTEGCLQLRQDNGSISALFTGRIDVVGND